MPDRQVESDQLDTRDPCDGCDGSCGDVCPVLEAKRLAYERIRPDRGEMADAIVLLRDERDRLRAALAMVRENAARMQEAGDRLTAELERLVEAENRAWRESERWKNEAVDLRAENERLREDFAKLGGAFADLFSQALNGVVCDPGQDEIGRHNCRACRDAWRDGRAVLKAYDPMYANVIRSGPMFQPDFSGPVDESDAPKETTS